MSQQVYQMQLAFAPAEDRLLFRIKTRELAEVRLWLTRRMVKLLWPALKNQLITNEQVQQQGGDQARQKAVLAFQHEQALSTAQFGKGFKEESSAMPLGTAPALVSRIRISPAVGGSRTFRFELAGGKGIVFSLDDPALHSFCRLIVNALAKTDWGLECTVVDADTAAPAVKSLN